MSLRLTSQQHRLLAFLCAHDAAHGTTPSFEVMRVYLDLSSKSGIARMIDELEAKGCVARDGAHKHGLRILQRVPVSPAEVARDALIRAGAEPSETNVRKVAAALTEAGAR